MIDSAVLIAIIALASTLVGVLAKVLNELLGIIKGNTEANIKVETALREFIGKLGTHDKFVKDFLQDEILPVLRREEENSAILKFIQGHIVKGKRK